MLRKGITLSEIITVTVIIGVLSAIAIPYYINMVERQKTSEAIQLLGMLRQAQIRYQAVNGNYTSNCSLLDLDLDWSTLQYFNQPYCQSAEPVAGMVRKSNPGYGNYSFNISSNGQINCTPDSAVPGACSRLGY